MPHPDFADFDRWGLSDSHHHCSKVVKSFEYIPCVGPTKQWDGLELVNASLLVTPQHKCICKYHATMFGWGEAQYRGGGQGADTKLHVSLSMHSVRNNKGWNGFIDMGIFTVDANSRAVMLKRSSSCPPFLKYATPRQFRVRSDSWWGQQISFV